MLHVVSTTSLVLLLLIMMTSLVQEGVFCAEIDVALQTGHKKAIVTLFLTGTETVLYGKALTFFVKSLRYTGYNGEIIVMVTENSARTSPVNTVENMGVTILQAKELLSKNNNRYAKLVTKYHLWNLTSYDQLMYFDTDFVFLRNPDSAFAECGSSALCATVDSGMQMINKQMAGQQHYFNAGFMVIRPNHTVFNNIMSQRSLADNKAFVEQDALNIIFRDQWKALRKDYNVQIAVTRGKPEGGRIIAIHEKVWTLQKEFPEQKYLWNSPKFDQQYAPLKKLYSKNSSSSSNSSNSSSSSLVSHINILDNNRNAGKNSIVKATLLDGDGRATRNRLRINRQRNVQ